MNQTIVFGTLIILMAMFIWDRIRYDFVALGGLFLIAITGVIPIQTAFYGFSNPAVVTVVAVMIISKGMQHCGLLDLITSKLKWFGKSPTGLVFPLSLLTAIASAFMNNVSVIIPISVKISKLRNHSASLVLMPLAFATLLGGMVTLLGSAPNIIVSSIREETLGSPYGIFDFFNVGIVLAIMGIVYISLIGWRFLPANKSPVSIQDTIDIEDYCTELIVPADSPLVNLVIDEVTAKYDVEIFGIIRRNKYITSIHHDDVFQADDVLMIEADSIELKVFMGVYKLPIAAGSSPKISSISDRNVSLVEVVVMKDSLLVGSTASGVQLKDTYGITLLAKSGKSQAQTMRISRRKFKVGDVLLLQGNTDSIAEQLLLLGCMALTERGYYLGNTKKIPLYLAIFGLSIVLVLLGLLPVHIAFPLAALGMVLFDVIPYREVYKAVDWSVIVMLGAMIPFGRAMTISGAADLIGTFLASLATISAPWVLVSILLLFTMLLTNLINNATTAIIMAPIAIGLAKGHGGNPDLFLMTVAVGACSAFLTPIGHPANTLVKGPGAYRFGDYWKLGLGVQLINLVCGSALLMYYWG